MIVFKATNFVDYTTSSPSFAKSVVRDAKENRKKNDRVKSPTRSLQTSWGRLTEDLMCKWTHKNLQFTKDKFS